MTGALPSTMKEEDKLHKAILASIGLGLGEVIGGFTHGQILDNYGTRVSIFTNIVLLILAMSMLIWFTYHNHFQFWSATLLNFLWGLQDSGVNCFIYCICGFQFETNEHPLAIYIFFAFFFAFVFSNIESFLSSQLNLLIFFWPCYLVLN